MQSQYFTPFFLKTSAIRPGMLSINFWVSSWLMAAHSCIINAWSLSELVGFCLSTRLLRIDHNGTMGFSMGFRSGEFPGHGPKKLMFCSPSHLVITFALCQGAPSCWKRHCSSPNCSWMVGKSCSRRMFRYHSLFMAVFLGKIVSEPTALAEKQPHTWMVSGCFTVGMTQDWW